MLALFSALGMVLTFLQTGVSDALGSAHFLLTSSLLLVRRSRPLLVAGAVMVLDVAGIAAGLVTSPTLPEAIAFYSLIRYSSGRPTLFMAVAGIAAYGTVMEFTGPGYGQFLAGGFVVAVPVGVGALVKARAELNERGRREAADAAVQAERRRIARELHDVVAHHITVINALVGGARATLAPEQEVPREALESAQQTARQAMSEMRRLLHVLRADGNDGPDAATGVGADRLPALIGEARSAGLPAGLTVTGEPVPLPSAVDHAVYRIVQEALTNTRKHAAGARASVRLAYEPEAVEVEVLDDGVPQPGGAPGFGLGGMAERVALCGGQLSTGPRPGGGFRVHARIPLEAS
ncbi:sensor histidine kinase [Nonomuraea spiralis]|uniref:sensor histidine kinase n=1 Tax=Nonomuraea TaxID=83681 RepID=UPI000F7B9FB8|nr:histidine kinase [Nonomuraea sp. WAC 01424]RSN01075.1 sensor histidine kinase [Nonomuraea sp. WAC 01424]